MRISWKSFFLSFGAAILFFSLVMACICTNVFGRFVPNAEQDSDAMSLAIAKEERASCESYLFYCNNKENETLDFALLVRIDEKEKRLLVTPLDGGDLIERQGMFFYIRSLCQTYGTKELLPIFEALTGCEVDGDRILNLRDYLPNTVKESTVKYFDCLEILPTVWEETKDGFSLLECPLVAEENQGLKILNIEKSLEAFLLTK